MGITKSWTSQSTGISGDHWHVTSIVYNEEELPIPHVQCIIKLWKDAQHCRDKKKALHTEMIVLQGEDYTNYVNQVNGTGAQPGEFKAALYEYLMTLPNKPWSDGILGPDIYGVEE